MNWKFWQKNNASDSGAPPAVKLPKPKELSQQVGIFLITKLKEDPDWVWTLKMVTCPQPDNKYVVSMRIYNPQDALLAGVAVANYHSLDAHADLILFEGSYNKSAGVVDVARRLKQAA